MTRSIGRTSIGRVSSHFFLKMRVIITGPSSSGKTSTLEALANKGYKTVSESAREILENSKPCVHAQVFMAQRQYTKEMNRDGINIFDRSLIDYDVFTRHYYNHVLAMPCSLHNRYDLVFTLEQLAFEKDDCRIEDNVEETLAVHEKVLKAYQKKGYNPILVPKGTINDRLELIESTLYQELLK